MRIGVVSQWYQLKLLTWSGADRNPRPIGPARPPVCSIPRKVLRDWTEPGPAQARRASDFQPAPLRPPGAMIAASRRNVIPIPGSQSYDTTRRIVTAAPGAGG